MWFKVKQSLIEEGYDTVVNVEIFVKQIKVNYKPEKRIYSCYELDTLLTHLSMIIDIKEVRKVEEYVYENCEYIQYDQKEIIKAEDKPKPNINQQMSLF